MNTSTTLATRAQGPDRSHDNSVFINCPFDGNFQITFDTIVFTVLCCGLYPRCAIETRATSVSRMDRIAKALRESRYSIHDLTRCQGERDTNLARMNMPLELGMALEQNYIAQHEWMVLAPRAHRYDLFISDLAGFDLPTYDESAQSVVSPLLGWLGSMPALRINPDLDPTGVVSALPAFLDELDKLRGPKGWRENLPWQKIVGVGWRMAGAHGFLPGNGSR